MTDISVSVWLPVGRANFYSMTTNDWLKPSGQAEGDQSWCSSKLAIPNYVPVLQCSVLRRLLEVLPLSFGYEPTGVCALASGEPDEKTRPVSVTMTLTVAASLAVPDDYWIAQRADRIRQTRQRANGELRTAGVETVRLFVDEHGNYCFTATVPDGGDPSTAEKALVAHVREVFGGSYTIKRREKPTRWEGAAAVRRYNGLTETAMAPLTEPEEGPERHELTEPRVDEIDGPPVGALTFFQLNTLMEGVCNDTLWPAVFFERYDFLRVWLDQPDTTVSKLSNIGEIINAICTQVDASELPGQITTLRHFLAVTSRESLQRIKWSVESVRRSLLDSMMSVMHRQSRLTQLDLAAIKRERSPELATKATESQLRGYVMLAAAKLPLIGNVQEIAQLAFDHIRRVAPVELADPRQRLENQLDHWKVLLTGLNASIDSLEKAVEQAWMERLLYEEEQSRSEQEAMAEIERSRFGRPVGRSPGRLVYDSFNLLLTALALLFVVRTTDLSGVDTGSSWWQQLARLWPVAVAAGVFYLIIPGFGFVRQWNKDRRGRGDSYAYEFTFIFDEPTSQDRIQSYVENTERERIRRTAAQLEAELRGQKLPARVPWRRRRRSAAGRAHTRPLPALSLTRLGGGRIERMSQDNTTFKLHSVLVFRVAPFKYAKFEVVNEIIVSQASDLPKPVYYLRQIRIFGDSPRPLPHATIAELIGVIHHKITLTLASEAEVQNPIELIKTIYQTPPRPRRRRAARGRGALVSPASP